MLAPVMTGTSVRGDGARDNVLLFVLWPKVRLVPVVAVASGVRVPAATLGLVAPSSCRRMRIRIRIRIRI